MRIVSQESICVEAIDQISHVLTALNSTFPLARVVSVVAELDAVDAVDFEAMQLQREGSSAIANMTVDDMRSYV